MNTALLITADAALTEAVSHLALRAGAHLSVHPHLAATPVDRDQARLVLVGADQAGNAGNVAEVTGAVTVSAGEADTGPPAVLHVVRDEPILRRYLEQVAAATVGRLRAAGYRIGYVYPHDAGSGYVAPLKVTDRRLSPDQAVYVNAATSACTGDRALSSSAQRSNYAILHQRFPAVWRDTHATDLVELGAFVADLSPAAVDVLCSLDGSTVVLDTQHHRSLQAAEIEVSWDQEADVEVYHRLGARARKVWDVMPAPLLHQLVWQVIHGTGIAPVHDGTEPRWPVNDLAAPLAARIMAEFRRMRVERRYRITTLLRVRRNGPRYAILVDDNPWPAALVYSRFEAALWMWVQQHSVVIPDAFSADM
ncbi:hypothetical protein ACTOB_003705 [Actinoplanes oblitus]|uniref:Uncharacterized protein n=1 Tax=Actinoplanes oblitus TaxID=3040509 RepID=A0ABY8WQ86_9ACTN|nr:hypothetical protein [Actinoplanes oblitus]WIN00030.1 hypothetical protein ACTOB_003705 [Actinoplanes oblitus]